MISGVILENKRIAWDTCVFIDAIQGALTNDFIGPVGAGLLLSAQYWPHIEPMLSAAESGQVQIVTSEIVVAETCHLDDLQQFDINREQALELLRESFDANYLLRVPAGENESELAAQLQRDYTLSTCDALIAATAAVHGADVLYTRDGCSQTAKRRRKKHKKLISVSGEIKVYGGEGKKLEICEPNDAHFLDSPLYQNR